MNSSNIIDLSSNILFFEKNENELNNLKISNKNLKIQNEYLLNNLDCKNDIINVSRIEIDKLNKVLKNEIQLKILNNNEYNIIKKKYDELVEKYENKCKESEEDSKKESEESEESKECEEYNKYYCNIC